MGEEWISSMEGQGREGLGEVAVIVIGKGPELESERERVGAKDKKEPEVVLGEVFGGGHTAACLGFNFDEGGK